MPCQQHKAATTETFRSRQTEGQGRHITVLRRAWMKNVKKKLEETIHKITTNTIGYTKKQANKEWFDEECVKVNEEKNAARERAIQTKTRRAKNAYKLARTKEKCLFRKKARQLDEEAFIEMERHRSIQDSRKFYKRLNDVRGPFEPQVAMCRA
jgi:hypothetical protein